MEPNNILIHETSYWIKTVQILKTESNSLQQEYSVLRKRIENQEADPSSPLIKYQLASLIKRINSISWYLSKGYMQVFIFTEVTGEQLEILGEQHIVHTSLNHESIASKNLFSTAHPLSLALKEVLSEADGNDWPLDFHYHNKDYILTNVCDLKHYQPTIYDFFSLSNNVADKDNNWFFYSEDGLRLLQDSRNQNNTELDNKKINTQKLHSQNVENKKEDSTLSETWFNSVLSSQLNILKQAPKGVVVLTGVAGSGKTSVALLRPALLCEGFVDENGTTIHQALDPQRCAGFVRTTQLKSYLETSIKESDSLLLRDIKIEAYDEVRQKLAIKYHIHYFAERCEDTLETILGSKRFQIILTPFLIDKIYMKVNEICKILFSVHKKVSLESIYKDKKTDVILKGFKSKYNIARLIKKVHKYSSSLRVNSKSWRLFIPSTQNDLTDSFQKEETKEGKKNIRRAKRLMNNLASNVRELEIFINKNRKNISDMTSHKFIQRYLEVSNEKEYSLLMILLIDAYKEVIRTKKIWDNLEKFIKLLDKATIKKQKDLLQQRAKNKQNLSDSDIDVLLYQLFIILSADKKDPTVGLIRNLEHLLIDEFQDFSWVQLKIIKALLPQDISMTLVGDFQQSLSYSGVHSIDQIKTIFPNSIDYHLDKNMRQSRPLYQFSTLYRKLIQQDSREIYGTVMEGDDPTKIDNSQVIATILSFKKEFPSKTICVIFPTEEEATYFYDKNREKIERKFHKVSLSTELNSYLHKRQPIHICTSKPTKGLEFDAVVCINLDHYTLSDPVQRDMLYVALSRAKTNLWITLANPAKDLLKDFLDKSKLRLK